MKLKRCYIENFGGLRQKTFFFQEGITAVLEENGFAIFEISPDLQDGLVELLRLILPNYRYEFIFDINHFLRFLYIEK